MQQVADFRFHPGTLQQDLAGSPQALQAGLDPPAQSLLLHGSLGWVLALHQHEVNLTMALQYGSPLGFRRVRREHGLNVDRPPRRAPVGIGKGRLAQQPQLRGPGVRLAGRPAGRLPQPPHLVHGVLFHHVEQLKGHRERLCASRRKSRPFLGRNREGLLHQSGQFTLPYPAQTCLEAPRREANVLIPFPEFRLEQAVCPRPLRCAPNCHITGSLPRSVSCVSASCGKFWARWLSRRGPGPPARAPWLSLPWPDQSASSCAARILRTAAASISGANGFCRTATRPGAAASIAVVFTEYPLTAITHSDGLARSIFSARSSMLSPGMLPSNTAMA